LGRSFLLGSVYVGLGNWISAPVNLAIQILIARMLGPEAYGLYAFVFAVSGFLGIVGAFSLGLAVIQAREESQSLYDTALAINVGLGLIGLVAAAAVAPLLWIHRTPQAAWFLLVMALGRIALLMSMVPYARLERTLRYGPLAIITLITRNVPNFVALGLVWAGFGLWSLPIRDVLASVLELVLKTAVSGYRFRGSVGREAGRVLMRFSRPMFLTRTLDTASQWTDRVAVGAFLGNTATGLYHQARLLTETGVVAMRPFFPMVFNLYARVQDDRPRLSRSFSIVNYFLARVTCAGAVVLLVFPAETVRLLLGDAWVGTAPLLRWLALYTALLPVLSNFRQLLSGTGRVSRNARIAAQQLLLFVPAVVGSALLGSAQGVAASLVIVTLVGLVLAWRASVDLLDTLPVHLLLTPAALVGGTAALFGALQALGVVGHIAWFLRPFLPALAYGAGLLALEHALLRRELVYLRGQLKRDGQPEPTP
jgi:O-antigen/teichoic acid export membrane protein